MSKSPTSASEDTPVPTVNDYAGKKLGILGLILSCAFGAVGLIVSSIALAISARAHRRNVPALWGIVIGLLTTVAFIIGMWYFLNFWEGNTGPCAELGPGVHRDGLVTYSCD